MAYTSLSSHRSMVFDDFRNERYAAAIRQAVTPESVVLDLGAGLGMLGFAAALAGAKRVYLVEPSPVVRLAARIAKANGLAEGRVVVLEGGIEEVSLPEPVDLIVSVFTGNLLFSEDLLPYLFHARDRHLKPGGRLIPDAAELLLAPVHAPELHELHVAGWSQPAAGIDFSPARNIAVNDIYPCRRGEQRAERLAPPALIASLDLATAASADCDGSALATVGEDSLCHGLEAWIRIRLGTAWLGTSLLDPDVHWSPMYLPIDPPLQLEAGEEIELRLNRPESGDWTWSLNAKAGLRRHSSFLSRLDGPRQLMRYAPDARPGLGHKGETVRLVLELLHQGRSNREIAKALMEAFPARYAGPEAAMRQVQDLVRAYAGASGK